MERETRYGAQRGAELESRDVVDQPDSRMNDVHQLGKSVMNIQKETPQLIGSTSRQENSVIKEQERTPRTRLDDSIELLTNDGAAYEDDCRFEVPLEESQERNAHNATLTWNPLKRLEGAGREPMQIKHVTENMLRNSIQSNKKTLNDLHSQLSPTDTLLLKMAETMNEVLKKVSNQDSSSLRWMNSSRGIPYKYSGLDYENPTWFVGKMNQYFQDAKIEEDIEKINLFGEQLRGKAKQWFDCNLHLTTGYTELISLFFQKFDSPEELAEVLSRLYGEKQPVHEAAASFISRKRRMCDRLIPNTPFPVTSSIIINQLEPELRSHIRMDKVQSYEELIRIASKIEMDLEEVRKNVVKRRTPSNTYPTVQVVRNPGRQNNEMNYQAPYSRSAGASQETTQQTNVTLAKPPSPCRYCGEWHFHAQCPRNAIHRGNENRAERIHPRDASSAHTTPHQSQSNLTYHAANNH